MTGANSHQAACALRDDLIMLLNKGGFPLRKWAENDPSLFPKDSDRSPNTHMGLDPNSAIKTLGIHWNSLKDSILI